MYHLSNFVFGGSNLRLISW